MAGRCERKIWTTNCYAICRRRSPSKRRLAPRRSRYLRLAIVARQYPRYRRPALPLRPLRGHRIQPRPAVPNRARCRPVPAERGDRRRAGLLRQRAVRPCPGRRRRRSLPKVPVPPVCCAIRTWFHRRRRRRPLRATSKGKTLARRRSPFCIALRSGCRTPRGGCAPATRPWERGACKPKRLPRSTRCWRGKRIDGSGRARRGGRTPRESRESRESLDGTGRKHRASRHRAIREAGTDQAAIRASR